MKLLLAVILLACAAGAQDVAALLDPALAEDSDFSLGTADGSGWRMPSSSDALYAEALETPHMSPAAQKPS